MNTPSGLREINIAPCVRRPLWGTLVGQTTEEDWDTEDSLTGEEADTESPETPQGLCRGTDRKGHSAQRAASLR